MDQLNEKLRVEEEEKLMGQTLGGFSGPALGMHKSPSTSSNGSRVAVPEEVMTLMLVMLMVLMVTANHVLA